MTALPVEVSDVDDFGMSPEFVERWQPVLERVLFDYFRTELLGLERLPPSGPAILVCNPLVACSPLRRAAACKVAVREGRGQNAGAHPGRDVRPLSEDFVINAPFAGSFLNRFGLVRASRDNAERLLRDGQIIAAFPEGALGIGKLYRNRSPTPALRSLAASVRARIAHRRTDLSGGAAGRGRSPAGGHQGADAEAAPAEAASHHSDLPALGPIGLLPLPSRWNIQVGDAIRPSGGAAAADDQPTVARVTARTSAPRCRACSGRSWRNKEAEVRPGGARTPCWCTGPRATYFRSAIGR